MPRVPPFDRPATYEDLVKLPDHLVAEIVDGELHASPKPAPAHIIAGRQIQLSLRNIVRVEPFGAIDLELRLLWSEPADAAT